jgi:tetratricopeptide (TPR) repeat protein
MEPTLTWILLEAAAWLLARGLDRATKVVAEDPVDRAIEATSQAFPELVVDVALRQWIESGELGVIAHRFMSTPADGSDEAIVSSFIENGDFSYPENVIEVARPVVETFLQQLLEQSLRGEDGHVVLSARVDAQSEFIRQTVLDSASATAQQLDDSMRSQFEAMNEQLRSISRSISDDPIDAASLNDARIGAKIDVGRSLLLSGKPVAAREQLSEIEGEAERLGVAAETLFRIKANLGACALELGDLNKAKDEFAAARDLSPESWKAHTNLALVLALQGQLDDAQVELDVARRNGDSDRSTIAIVQVSIWSRSGDLEAIQDLQKQAWVAEDSTCSLAIGRAYLLSARPGDAIEPLRIAVSLDDSNPHANLGLAQALFEQRRAALRGVHTLPWNADSEQQAQLEEAESLLTRAIDRLEAYDERSALLDALAGRSAVRALLGKPTEATADADRVLLEDAEHVVALKNRAILHFRSGEYVEARDMLSKVVRLDPDALQEVALPLTYSLKATNDAGEILSILERHWALDDSSLDLTEVLDSYLWAFAKINGDDAAEARLDDARRCWPGNPSVDLAIARFLVDRQPARALQLVAEALTNLPESSEVFRLEAAKILFDLEEYSTSADVFGPLVDTENAGDSTRLYAMALFNAGRYGEALALAKGIRRGGSPMPVISEIEALVLEAYGDLDGAEALWRGLEDSDDGDRIKSKLSRVKLAIRRGDNSAAKVMLDGIQDENVSEPERLMTIAQARHVVGDPSGALGPAYRARRLAFDDPRIHMAYMGIILGSEGSPTLDAPTEIGPGTAALLRCGEQEPRWVSILSRDFEVNRQAGEVPVGDPLAERLVGHRVGDQVVLRDAPLEEAAACEIVELQSIYVRAFQESISNFGDWFPTDASLQQVRVDGDDVAGLEAAVLRRHEQVEKAMQAYFERRLPLGVLARLVGVPLVELYMGMMASPDARVLAASGSIDEREEGERALGSDKLVLELTGLLTLHLLGLVDEVLAATQIVVAQSLLDTLTETVQLRRATSAPVGTLMAIEGRLASVEIDPQEYESGTRQLESLKERVIAHATIAPVEAILNMSYPDYMERSEVLGGQALDALLIAAELNEPLYSDDLGLRLFARSEFEVAGVWTQHVLGHVFQTELELDAYHRAITTLARAHVGFLSLSVADLIWAFREDGLRVGEGTKALLASIGRPEVDEEAAVAILADFAKVVWLEPALFEMKLGLIDAVIETLDGSNEPRPLVLSKFLAALKTRLALLPQALETIERSIQLWRARRDLGSGLLRP